VALIRSFILLTLAAELFGTHGSATANLLHSNYPSAESSNVAICWERCWSYPASSICTFTNIYCKFLSWTTQCTSSEQIFC